jgi:hypothetical protein
MHRGCGTEHRAIELANRLRDAADVVLWTQNRNLPSTFTSGHTITLIDESRGVFPQGGTLLVCGSYIRVGNWFRQATFRRVVVLYNVVDPIGFSTLLQQVCLAGKPKVELLLRFRLDEERHRIARIFRAIADRYRSFRSRRAITRRIRDVFRRTAQSG